MQRMILFFLVAASIFPALSIASEPAVMRQEVAVMLVPTEKQLVGSSTLVVPSGRPETLSLRLSDRASVTRTAVDGSPVSFRFSGGLLSFQLPERRTEATVSVEYRVVFDDPLPERIVSSEDPTYGVTATISPTGVYLGGGTGWYPEPASPLPQRTFRITGPKGWRAVTAGRLVEVSENGGEARTVWQVEKPLGNLALSAGRYLVEERNAGPIPVSTWLLFPDRGLSDRYLKALEEYLPLYVRLLGRYPFEKFAVVENFLPTGYGYPSYTLIGGDVLRLPFIVTTSLPHELVHSWWGTGVEVAEGGNWSEGLTSYLADYLLEERRSAEAARDYRLKVLTDYASLVPQKKDFPLSDFQGRVDAASRAVGYGKSAMVFHLLRRVVGDEPFFAALRQLAAERMYGSASWADFGRAFTRASGKPVEPLLKEMVSGTGGIDLGLEELTAAPAPGGWKVSGALRQGTLSMAIPVTLLVETEGKGEERRIVLAAKGSTRFEIVVQSRPERLVMDPDLELFRRLVPRELPPTVNGVKGSQRLLVVRCDSYRGEGETTALLLESLGVKNAPVVPEEGLSPERLREHDLLFLGVPRRELAKPRLPAGFVLLPDRFTVRGQPFSAPADLLFLAAHNPAAPERTAAFFVPLSAEAGRKGVLKIQHYGRYGYLVFREGTNTAKGGFPPSDGPAVVRFSR